MPKPTYDSSTRRFNLDLDEETFNRLNHFLRPGERATIFRAIIDDLLDLMEKIGPGLIIAGITQGQLGIQDYTRICSNLKQIFDGMDKVKNELQPTKTLDNISSSPRRYEDNNVLQGGKIQTYLPGKETFQEIISETPENINVEGWFKDQT